MSSTIRAPVPATAPASERAAHVRLVLCMLFWGQMVPGFVVLLQVWDPFALAAVRYLLSAPLMLGLLWLRFRRIDLPPLDEIGRLVLLGTVGMGCFVMFYTIGLAFADPVSAIVVQTASPLLHTAIAVLVYREKAPAGLAAALALVIPGGLLLAAPAWMGTGQMSFRGGEFLLILGSLCWSWYSLQCRRWLPHYDEIRLTAWTMVSAVPFLLGLFLALLALGLTRFPDVMPSAGANLLLLYLVVSSSCVGIVLWHGGVGRLGLATAALYYNIAPLFAILIGMAMGFMPNLWQWLGGGLVLAGVGQIHLRRYRALRRSA
ncbi:DMT family transporter [Marinivivus vitaminiproducens]|uniref:DMT family transporter n=1 Tax=Marinivivus vitaminiproducens TaxID=3035935 RepID=UPI00279BCDD4|nr:DMT family transporter [Geminicoccaceae bacterium SCSIO 64248]